jgi:hypothetical protein
MRQGDDMRSTYNVDSTVARNSDNAVERTQVNAYNRHLIGEGGEESEGAEGGGRVKSGGRWGVEQAAARFARYVAVLCRGRLSNVREFAAFSPSRRK